MGAKWVEESRAGVSVTARTGGTLEKRQGTDWLTGQSYLFATCVREYRLLIHVSCIQSWTLFSVQKNLRKHWPVHWPMTGLWVFFIERSFQIFTALFFSLVGFCFQEFVWSGLSSFLVFNFSLFSLTAFLNQFLKISNNIPTLILIRIFLLRPFELRVCEFPWSFQRNKLSLLIFIFCFIFFILFIYSYLYYFLPFLA